MSKLDELSARPATIVFTSRVDDRHLATLALFWRSKGEQFSSVSSLARLSLETFCEFLVQSGAVDFVSTHAAALEILENIGLRPDKVNPRNLAKALVAEGHTFEPSARPIDLQHQEQVRTKPVGGGDNPILRAAEEELRKRMASDLNSRVAKDQESTQEFKDQFSNVSKTNTTEEEDK